MIKVLSLSTLALAVLAGCNTTTVATDSTNLLPPQQLVISPNDQRSYQTITLDNQIEVVLVSDPKVEKSAAALSVGVGLLHDPMSQQGMAHYLEHMLFLGTERFPDTKGYSEFMANNGGAHNAYTWLDITNYMFKVNNDAFEQGLDRFADFFKAPKLYPEYTDKEKNAVNAEWSMRREMDFFGQYKLSRKMMGDHPANRFLIGNLETLGDKQNSNLHQQTVDFYNKFYSSNIMKVALISNKPLTEMSQLAKQYFSDIKNKQIKKPQVIQSVDISAVGGKKVFYKPNEDVKQLKLDFTIKNNTGQFAVKPNRFISYLLSSEMPGTPAQILRDQGLVSLLTSSSSPDLYGNYGNLTIDLQLTDAGMKRRDYIVTTLMQYINLIREQGVDAKYYQEIKTSLNNQFRFLEKGDEFAYVSNLTDSMQKYPLNNVIDAPYYFGKFDAQAINSVLEQLTPKSLKIWYISQNEQTDSKLHFYDGQYAISDISEQEVASWDKKAPSELALPTVNRMLPESFVLKTDKLTPQAKPALIHDKDGIKIWHQPSRLFASQPKGLLEVYFNNPDAQQNINSKILLSIWSDLYQLQQSALTTEASIAGMDLSVMAANGLLLTINGFTDKQDNLLQQALDALTVKVEPQGFAQAIDRFVRELANAGKQFPINQVFGEFSKVIKSGNYERAELIAAAKQLSVSDLNRFIAHTLSHNQVRSFAFGNYDTQDIKDIAAKLTAYLPKPHTVTNYTRSKVWQPQPGEVMVFKKDLDVADVAIIDLHVHPEPGYKQKARASILQRHFRTQVFDKLRTEEQLAYAVGVLARPIDQYASFGMYIQSPVKGPKEMQARFDLFKDEYAKQLEQLSESTFAKLKNATLVGLTEKPKNLQAELSPLIRDWFRENFDFDSKAKLISEVEKVTLADVKAFYHETMASEEAARLNIQLRGNKFKQSEFANIKGQTEIKNIEQFHQLIKFQ